MMEISQAVKSPSIHYHLAGTKKVQQELAKPGILEKFLGDKAQMESVRDIFTGLYSLDKVGKLFYQFYSIVVIV
jgi:glutathione synthase